MKHGKLYPVLICFALAALLAAGCGGYYQNAGADPARVRVVFSVTADRDDRAIAFEEAGIFTDILPNTYWDWGLFEVRSENDWTPLAPADGQQLNVVVANNTLTRDAVFLVPPGRHKLALLVQGYVKVRHDRFYDPRVIAGFQQFYEVDLKPGETMTIHGAGAPAKP